MRVTPSFKWEAAVQPTGIELAAMSSYVIIIRCIWSPAGPQQQAALDELDRRGMWLTDDQKAQAGLACPWPRNRHEAHHAVN